MKASSAHTEAGVKNPGVCMLATDDRRGHLLPGAAVKRMQLSGSGEYEGTESSEKGSVPLGAWH